MGTKADKRAAYEVVAAYHERCLAELVARVAEAVDRHRAGEADAFDVDQVIHGYTKAARKLWTFCQVSGGNIEATAYAITKIAQDGDQIDRWHHAEPPPKRT